jgi:transcription antitermination factor NusG
MPPAPPFNPFSPHPFGFGGRFAYNNSGNERNYFALIPAPMASGSTDGQIFSSAGMPRWYALRVRSNFEKPVSNLLQSKGLEEYLPVYRARRLWSDRIRQIDMPLFPGYVFCRISPGQCSSMLATTGVVTVVGIQNRPLPIDDEEIAVVRRMVESRSVVEPWPFLQVGQRVRVRRGPLAGVEGILIKMKNSCRLVVSVSLLGRSVATEFDAAYLTRI